MKASDIADDVMVAAVRANAQGVSGWAMRMDVQRTLSDFPEKVVRAKYRQLEKRGILGGCSCGCRGDWHVLEDMEDGKSYGGPWNGRTK